MSSGHEEYAIDCSAEFEEHLYARATPEAQMAFEQATEARETHARLTWRSVPADEVARFRAAAEAVRRLRADGKGVREIMTAFRLRDPASVRRLEGVLDWLEIADTDAGAASLASLSKRTFLAVVSRGILTLNDLSARAGELQRLPAFSGQQLQEIRSLLANVGSDSPLYH